MGSIDLRRREKNRQLLRFCRPTYLAWAMLFVIPILLLFSLTLLYPQPGGSLARLAQRPDLLGAVPARILLEGAKNWYQAILLIGLVLLLLVAAILLLLLRGILVHLGWRRKRRKERAAAKFYLFQVSINPMLVVDDPWNYNEKSGPDPTPGWWDGVMKDLDRATDFLETATLHAGAVFSHVLAILPLLLMTGLMALMLLGDLGGNVPQLYAQAREDIAQIEAGQCETITVFLSPKVRPWHIDGPYTSSQPTLLTRYGAIGKDTGHQWFQVYVPYGMDFALDEDRLFNENYSVPWNAENAQMYEVIYTTQFRFVVAIRPVEAPADFWE